MSHTNLAENISSMIQGSIGDNFARLTEEIGRRVTQIPTAQTPQLLQSIPESLTPAEEWMALLNYLSTISDVADQE
jgi:hypothetical protein